MTGYEDTREGNLNAARTWQRAAAIAYIAIDAMAAVGRLDEAIYWQRELAWKSKVARDFVVCALGAQS